MWKIGDLYENSPVGSNNLVLATDWYRKAKQSEKKQHLLQFYMDTPTGKLKPVSNDDVINALNKNARKGDVEAQLKLAMIYDDGELTQQDNTRAFKWYMKAAKNNNQYAQFMVGYFLCRGIGTSHNLKDSIRWLKKSGRKANCTEQ